MKLQPKLPIKGGVKKAVEAIKKFRKQQPSERLIKTISEIPDIITMKYWSLTLCPGYETL